MNRLFALLLVFGVVIGMSGVAVAETPDTITCIVETTGTVAEFELPEHAAEFVDKHNDNTTCTDDPNPGGGR